MLALGALAWVVDDAAGLGLLPPVRSLVPGLSANGPVPRSVSETRIAQATTALDRMLAARLRPRAETASNRTRTASSASAPGSAAGSADDRARSVGPIDFDAAIPPIENPCTDGTDPKCRARALDRFYAALRRTALGEPGAVTRITHFGDSLIVEDLLTSTVRRRLQERFGDAGRGFLFVGRPWEWYGRLDVDMRFTDAWHVARVTIPHIHDDRYGFGGVSFTAVGPGSKATFSTTGPDKPAAPVSRFDVYYLEQPGGGSLEVSVDGVVRDTFAMDGPDARSAFRLVEMPDAPHEIAIRSLGGGPVRLFGVTLEREGPGVVYDAVGILGASARALLVPDETHMAEQFAHRHPDLVVLTFGTNESDGMPGMDGYRDQLREVLRRVRAVAPFASCLVAGPPDRGDPATRETRSIIPKIVEAQHEVALAEGCAFWNTFEAMGGKNSMGAWYRMNPRRSFGDLTHFAPPGGEVVGNLLTGALLRGFVEYLDRAE